MLEKLLDSKKLNPKICKIFKGDIKKEIEILNKNIINNKDIIIEINKKIDNSSNEETELRKTIGQKYLFDFYTNKKTDFDKIMILNEELKNIEQELEREKNKLPNTDVLPNIVLLFNKFLHNFLGLNKYEAKIEEETISLQLNKVNISRETKKISEGEKIMIGLCYFLAASIQKFNSLEKYKNSIFIIDDPICSTSYGNFFGICNLLKEFDYQVCKKI